MFARHYLRNLGWFLFLGVLRWFSSPGSLRQSYVFRLGYTLLCGFPHSDIAVSLLFCQLLRAFRRLTRPSSPIIAKASTWCTYSLDSIIWRTFDFAEYSVDNHILLRFPNNKAYCFVVIPILPFVFQDGYWYNHHPNTVVQFFLTWVLFQAAWNQFANWFQTKSNQNCLCLLISAFQFVKERCNQLTDKPSANCKLKQASEQFYTNSL